MMMGAVYVGQLLHSATRCCLKDCGSLRVAMVLDHIEGMTLSLEVMKRYWWCLMMIGLRELQFESKLEKGTSSRKLTSQSGCRDRKGHEAGSSSSSLP